jgi:hypothetical protein
LGLRGQGGRWPAEGPRLVGVGVDEQPRRKKAKKENRRMDWKVRNGGYSGLIWFLIVL